MDLEFASDIAQQLLALPQKLTEQAREAVVNAVHSAVEDLEKRLPVSRIVSINDRINGIPQNNRPIQVSYDQSGATITVRPFYADARDDEILRGVRASGKSFKLFRTGLWVHKKAPGETKGPQSFVEFATSIRLKQWADGKDETRRHSIAIDSEGELQYVWGPIRARLVIDIHTELARKLSQK